MYLSTLLAEDLILL